MPRINIDARAVAVDFNIFLLKRAGFTFGDNAVDLRMKANGFEARARIMLRGPDTELPRWMAGFVQNVTSETTTAYYGARGAGKRLRRGFRVGMNFPVRDARPGCGFFASRPVGDPPARNAPVAGIGAETLRFLSPVLDDDPGMEIPWWYEEEDAGPPPQPQPVVVGGPGVGVAMEIDGGGEEDRGLPLRSLEGRITFQYWLYLYRGKVDEPGPREEYLLDTGTWAVDWSAAVPDVDRDPPRTRVEPAPGSGVVTPLGLPEVDVNLAGPDANGNDEYVVDDWV